MNSDPNQPQPTPTPEQTHAEQQPVSPTNIPPVQSTPTNQAEHGDTLGIVSIILAFFVPLIGLIVGIIGKSKGKSEGYDAKLSRIGVILNAVFLVLGLIIAVLYIALIGAAVSSSS